MSAALDRLREPGAALVEADDMDIALIVRRLEDGSWVRTAILPRNEVVAMYLRGELTITSNNGRVRRYAATREENGHDGT